MKENITYLFDSYGFLLPLFESMTGEQFANLIAGIYSTGNTRNKYYQEFARKHIKHVERIRQGYKYSLTNI